MGVRPLRKEALSLKEAFALKLGSSLDREGKTSRQLSLYLYTFIRSGRDANDARLRPARYAIVSASSDDRRGASPLFVLEQQGASGRSTRRDRKRTAARRSSRLSQWAQEGPPRSSRGFGTRRRAIANLSGRSQGARAGRDAAQSRALGARRRRRP